MATIDEKAVLGRYLHDVRDALLWKLEGLGEHDLRRPLTPTGTNLLGLAKHLAFVELSYLGDCLDRPSGIPNPWFEADPDPHADLWCPADEATADVLELHRRAAEHADVTIAALSLDAVGHVPWWPEERRHPTLHTLLVHVLVERSRHTGHADILREGLDGAAGLRRELDNLGAREPEAWTAHRARVEAAARQVAGLPPEG